MAKPQHEVDAAALRLVLGALAPLFGGLVKRTAPGRDARLALLGELRAKAERHVKAAVPGPLARPGDVDAYWRAMGLLDELFDIWRVEAGAGGDAAQ